METNITYDNQPLQVILTSFIPASDTPFPRAGIHPVVQARGTTISLLSPIELLVGSSFSMASGFDIPYQVRVQQCYSESTNEYRVLAIIE
jgi:hypothetical protein